MTDYLRSWALDDIVIRSGGDGRTVEAYAAIFDVPYEVRDQHGHYMEVIDRSAFNRTLKNGGASRVACLYNHGFTIHGTPDALASVPLGTPLEIRPDGRGLLTVTRYNRSELADATLEAIRNGDIRSQSFRGRIYRSTPAKLPRAVRRGGQLPTVTRHELGLADYGPTPIPVNAGAKILAVRSAVDVLEALDDLDDDEREAILEDLARHYPGRHRQASHGNRYGRNADGSRGDLRHKGRSRLDPDDDDQGDDDRQADDHARESSTSSDRPRRERSTAPKRLADTSHAAMEKLGARAAELAREVEATGRVMPLLADKVGVPRNVVSRLVAGGYVNRRHNMLGDGVELTDKGLAYLAGQSGNGDRDAALAREIADADAEASRLREEAAAVDTRGQYGGELRRLTNMQADAAEAKAQRLRHERRKALAGEADHEASTNPLDIARETAEREAAEREAAEAAAKAEAEADAAEWSAVVERVSANFGLTDHTAAKAAAKREARKAYGLPSVAEARRLTKARGMSQAAEADRERGHAAEAVYHAAGELAGARTAMENNRRQVVAARRELAKGDLRPANAAKLQEGIDGISAIEPRNREAIAAAERNLAAKVAEWQAGPEARASALAERERVAAEQRAAADAAHRERRLQEIRQEMEAGEDAALGEVEAAHQRAGNLNLQSIDDASALAERVGLRAANLIPDGRGGFSAAFFNNRGDRVANYSTRGGWTDPTGRGSLTEDQAALSLASNARHQPYWDRLHTVSETMRKADKARQRKGISAAPAAPASAAPAAPAAPKIPRREDGKAKRGDVLVIKKTSRIATANGRGYETTRFEVYEVTSATRDGEPKRVRRLDGRGSEYNIGKHNRSDFTGRRQVIPGDQVDKTAVEAALAAHTYTNSDTPKPYESFRDLAEAIRPAIRGDQAAATPPPAESRPATTANTPDAVMTDLAAALAELPGGKRKLGDTTPAASAAELAESLREGRTTAHSLADLLDVMAGLSDRGNANDVGPIIKAAAARIRSMPDTPRRPPASTPAPRAPLPRTVREGSRVVVTQGFAKDMAATVEAVQGTERTGRRYLLTLPGYGPRWLGEGFVELERSRSLTADLFGDITATPVHTGLGAEDSATRGHSGRLSIRRALLRAEMTKRGIR